MSVSSAGSHIVKAALPDAKDEPEKIENASPSGGTQSLASPEELDPNHPLNFSKWRKLGILLTVSANGFVANYSAAAHLTAFPEIAADLDTSVASVANAIGISILGLAVGPILVWNPLSKTIGRRPTYLLSSLLFIPCVVWISRATSFNSFAAARFFAGFTSAAAQTLPPTSIADIYKKEVRGDKIAVFSMMMTIALAIAPLVGGFVVANTTWRWIYYIVLIMAGVQFVAFLLLVPETLYLQDRSTDPEKQMSPVTGHRGAAWMPWQRPGEFLGLVLRPVVMSTQIVLLLPAILASVAFMWSVGITIVAPQTFREAPYEFSPEIIGVTYVAYAIGGVIGKPSGGIVGDWIVTYFAKRNGGVRQPEYRLWALFPLLPLLLGGLLIFGICIQEQTHWSAPLIGGGIYYFGMVGVFGIVQTQMVESNLVESMNSMAVFNLFKCMLGFAAPFFIEHWCTSESFTKAYVAQGVVVSGFGLPVALGLIKFGRRLRIAQGMPA